MVKPLATTHRAGGAGQRATRLGGLRRFSIGITTLNVLGHTVFGFEQSWAQPLAALAAAYATELVLEAIDARAKGRPPRFVGGPQAVIDFFLSAHISGLAVSMLLYANDRLAPVVFAAVTAIGSKAIVRITTSEGVRHLFNPSNLGISVTLLAFPAISIAPPYHFTERLENAGDWILPGAIVLTGTLLNARFTGRLPLIASWLSAFALQALVRSAVTNAPLVAGLLPMTGVAFILYTFYMVTDPATTPERPAAQAAFGAGVAVAYGCLMALHIVFGLFFALTAVSTCRGVGAWVLRRMRRPVADEVRTPALAGQVQS
jgi:enediyne biosynthesis protein E5